MKTYTYYFVDGTKSVVKVSDELYQMLRAFDKEEARIYRNEHRRHISLSNVVDKGLQIEDTHSDLFENYLKEQTAERINKAISQLTPSQQELIEMVYFYKMSVNAVALKQGVDQSAVSHRLMRIRDRLKEILS